MGRFAPARQEDVFAALRQRLEEAGREEVFALPEADFLHLFLFLAQSRKATPALYGQLYAYLLERAETLRTDTLTRALLAHAHVIRQMHDNINAHFARPDGSLDRCPELLRRKAAVKGLNERLLERVFSFAARDLGRLSSADLSRLLKAVAISGYRRRSMFFVLREVVTEVAWRADGGALGPLGEQICRDIAFMRLDERQKSELYQLVGLESAHTTA